MLHFFQHLLMKDCDWKTFSSKDHSLFTTFHHTLQRLRLDCSEKEKQVQDFHRGARINEHVS